jgi:hypothetical protein
VFVVVNVTPRYHGQIPFLVFDGDWASESIQDSAGDSVRTGGGVPCLLCPSGVTTRERIAVIEQSCADFIGCGGCGCAFP